MQDKYIYQSSLTENDPKLLAEIPGKENFIFIKHLLEFNKINTILR